MSSTEEQVSCGAVELRPSYHGIHCPNARTDHAGPEDPGDLRKGLDVAEPPHDQPARIVSDLDPCEIARRALDLMFLPDDDDWSAREGSSDDDVDHVLQVIDGEKEETDCPVDDCSTEEGSDYQDGHIGLVTEETNCPGKFYSETESEAEDRDRKWADSFFEQIIAHNKLCDAIMARGDEDDTPFPPHPMQVFPKDSFVLPLCSPCRGMYVPDKALLEVDLWGKNEGDESADKQLFSAYVEIDIVAEYDSLFCGRISGDNCNLDTTYTFFTASVEAAIQVYAKIDHPHHVRFTAFSTGYDDDGVLLFDDKLFGSEKIFQHIVAVKANEKLDVLLKVDNSLFKWTFQDECVGAVVSPDESIFDYGQFLVRVMFAPKDSQ